MAIKARFVLTERCNRACSIHPDNISFTDQVTEWFSEGRTFAYMAEESERLGRRLSAGSLSRHRQKHLERLTDGEPKAGVEPVDHLAVLQKIIASGAKKADTWRIGPSETLKAMQMYYQLTQGSAMQALWSALNVAASGAGEEEEEVEVGSHDAGSLSPAELESVGADD